MNGSGNGNQKIGIQGFDLPDSWNTCRFIVYSCNSKESPVAFRTDKLMAALAFIKKNSDRRHHFKLYDRVLNSFDLEKILKEAEKE